MNEGENVFILLSGKKQSGKDTCAKFFQEKGYQKFALADNLKDQLHSFLFEVLDVPPEKIVLWGDGDEKEKPLDLYMADGTNMTNRIAMQWYGQMMKQTFGRLYWVRLLEKDIRFFQSQNEVLKKLMKKVIVSDCRFSYEIDSLREKFSGEFNVYSIRINRGTKNVDMDISETELDKKDNSYFDFVIDNNGTIDDFLKDCERIYNYIS